MLFENTMIALQTVLKKSPYFEYLLRNSKEIGFKLSNEIILMSTNPKKGSVYFRSYDLNGMMEPELWVEIDEKELLELAINDKPISEISIMTSSRGQILNPVVERIIQRILIPPEDRNYPITDRVDLVYGGLFKFKEPRVIWRSTKSNLVVLKYQNVVNELDVYVTLGFTNPGIGSTALQINNYNLSGFGYELLVFSETNDTILGKELVNWTIYIENTGCHILRGQYLEYREKIITGTNLSGFIVVNPIGFPEVFPVSNGYGMFNMLLGVTKKELDIAKKEDIYIIADKLFKTGYINYSPVKRNSVI